MSKYWASASQMDRIIECPASAALPQTESTSEHARKGRNEHALIENAIRSGTKLDGYTLAELELPRSALPEVAFSWDVSSGLATELGTISGRGYPEAPFSTIFGTADVAGESEIVLTFAPDSGAPCVDVIDWKTGYEAPPPDSWQMKVLAFMAAKARKLDYARTRITHIRDGVRHSQWKLFGHNDFRDIENALRKTYEAVVSFGPGRMVEVQDVRHGPHCHFCPAFASCPYTKSLLHNAMAISDVVTGENAKSAYHQWQALRTITGRLEERLKGLAVQSPIDIGNGYLWGKPKENSVFRKFKKYDAELAELAEK